MFRKFVVLLFVLLPILVLAQTNPGVYQGWNWTPTQWNNEWSSKQDYPNTLMPTVTSNVGLIALNPSVVTTVPTRVLRLGFTTPGDGGAARYNFSTSACSLNSGAGDNGLQVAPSAGTGCWIADFSGQKVTPLIWGAAGTCTYAYSSCTDDTVPLQNAINATASLGITLYVSDATHGYYFTAPLTSAAKVDIEGWLADSNDGNGTNHGCASGLFANSDINGLVLTGPKVRVEHVCIQMAPIPGTTSRAAGAAILLGGVDQQNDIVSNNTIFYPYDGISWGGGTAPNVVKFSTSENNVIRDPARYGIAIGLNATNGQTAGITLNNNVIGCDAGYNTNGIGIAFFDGAISYNGTTNGPNNCYIGFEIVPGVNQNVNGHFTGVLGDSSGVHYTGGNTPHDLYINPSAPSGDIEWLYFANVWAGGVVYTDNEVYIGNTNGASCDLIKFTGLVAHGANFTSSGASANQTVPVVDIEGCNEVVLTGSQIDAWGAGTTTTGLNITSTPARLTVTGNHIGAFAGATLTNGISLASTVGYITATGNEIASPTTAINFSSASGANRIVFGSNEGVDDLCPAVASASTLPLASAYQCFHVTGTTTVTAFSGAYDNRKVTLFADSGSLTFNYGMNGLCGTTNVTIAQNTPISLYWNYSNLCWGVTS